VKALYPKLSLVLHFSRCLLGDQQTAEYGDLSLEGRHNENNISGIYSQDSNILVLPYNKILHKKCRYIQGKDHTKIVLFAGCAQFCH
jgi:hypothetical protein